MWLMRNLLFNLNAKERNNLYMYTNNTGETAKDKILLLPTTANLEFKAGIFTSTHNQETYR